VTNLAPTNLLEPITGEFVENVAREMRCALCLGSFQIVGTRRTPGIYQLKCRTCGELAYQHTIIYKEAAEKIERERRTTPQPLNETAEESIRALGF